jgi:hypothetical protein
MLGRFNYDTEEYEYDEFGEDLIDGVGFAQEGSALRAATPDNPRDRDCPNCGAENVLTRIDEERGYQCDRCADVAEGLRPPSMADY